MKFKYQTALAEILSVSSNPLVTTAKFVFADDLPNDNKQGVKFDEFEAIAANAVGMPIKINFVNDYLDGEGSSNHPGSYPIGHISKMEIVDGENGSHQLIGYAAIWNEEFPREVAWLKERMAAGDPPGLSWELKYREGIIENGIEWLKGVVASAATFVKFPAYGARTALLALASIQEPEDNPVEVTKVLNAIAEQLAPKEQPKAKGGNQMTEEEIQKLKDAEKAAAEKAEASAKEVERLTALLAEKEGEVTTLSEQVASLQKAALIDARVKTYTEKVGALPEEAAQAESKKEWLISFSEDQFATVIDEMVAIKKAATLPAAPASAAEAARKAMAGLQIPRLDPSTVEQPNLRAELKSLARPNSV